MAFQDHSGFLFEICANHSRYSGHGKRKPKGKGISISIRVAASSSAFSGERKQEHYVSDPVVPTPLINLSPSHAHPRFVLLFRWR